MGWILYELFTAAYIYIHIYIYIYIYIYKTVEAFLKCYHAHMHTHTYPQTHTYINVTAVLRCPHLQLYNLINTQDLSLLLIKRFAQLQHRLPQPSLSPLLVLGMLTICDQWPSHIVKMRWAVDLKTRWAAVAVSVLLQFSLVREVCGI